jgi:hypothetical protein
MGAGQAQILTQKLHQQGTGIDIGIDGITVHNQRNLGHSTLSSSAPPHIGGTVIKIIPKA